MSELTLRYIVIKVIIFLAALLTVSCAKQSITTTNTYEKALPFSKVEIKKTEAEQEIICAEYSAKSNARLKRIAEMDAASKDRRLTLQQKTEKYNYLMAHLNDGLEEAEQLKDKCDALNKKLDEMYEANHIAGDKFLEQRKRK
jgi:hypothetical protein